MVIIWSYFRWFIGHSDNIQIVSKRLKVNNINQKFFGVVPDLINKDRILFLGGQFLNFENNSPKKIFEFDINENEILQTNTDYENFDFIEKTFIPIENGVYMQFVEYKKDDVKETKILCFDGKEKEYVYRKICFNNK